MAFIRKQQKASFNVTALLHTLSPVLWCAGSLFLLISLISYHASDPSWFTEYSLPMPTKNWCGIIGAHCAAVFIYIFGSWSMIMPLLVLSRFFLNPSIDRIIGTILLLLVGTAWSARYHIDVYSHTPGGLVGITLQSTLASWFDAIGSFIVLHTLLFVSILLITRLTPLHLLQQLYAAGKNAAHIGQAAAPTTIVMRSKLLLPWTYIMSAYTYLQQFIITCSKAMHRAWLWLRNLLAGEPVTQAPMSIFSFDAAHAHDVSLDPLDPYWADLNPVTGHAMPATEPEPATPVEYAVSQESLNTNAHHEEKAQPYQLPDTSTLFGQAEEQAEDKKQQAFLKERAMLLEEKLERFGITGKVVTIKPGPVVTMFEYKPAIDTKLSKIITLEDDLALALQALSIRIIAPIPGTAFVGFEVANQVRKPVLLQHLLQSKEFNQSAAAVPLVLGVSTTGTPIIADLTRMPHLLIAGSTGSGKSVALHAILMSMLCNKKPDELKLMLIDPKRLEFSSYSDIGHLLTPVITDARVAICALRWAVRAMEDRYNLMAQAKVRNIGEYNAAGPAEPLPHLVIIIDELADLMMTAGADIEEAITRLSQMARAAGIHLIVATQRPSVDVITGLIKVNFPSRIALRVTSKIDSRTIIDASGAEKLLGRGDQLFMDAQNALTTRIHGAYVGDKEINAVVASIKQQGPPNYLDLGAVIAAGEQVEIEEEDDELLQEIMPFLAEVDEISISLLQRRFKIGYNRSARIMDLLQSMGKIMPADGGKMRKVVKQANT